MNKEKALSMYLNCDEKDFVIGDDNAFDTPAGEYLVLTGEEADEKARDYIRESLWTYRPEFLSCHIPSLYAEDIRALIGDRGESVNDALFKLIDDFDYLVEDAISRDGRGCLIAFYDFYEIELEGGFFAYRID